MQNRMKTHPMTKEAVEALLTRAQVGTVSTLDEDGSPYAVPVHFVYLDGTVCFHGLPKGQKIDNLKARPQVCFTAWDMQGFLMDPEGRPCDTNTKYESVVAKGEASVLTDLAEKQAVLEAIIAKYTPDLVGTPLPENMLRGTAVVKIEVAKLTGKYYA